MADLPLLMAVPNVSEGRDARALEAIERAFHPAAFLDLHVDADYGRAVFTLAAEQGRLAEALLSGGREVLARVNLNRHDGLHPCVGALDVMPVVYLDEERRGAACAEVLTAAAMIGEELELPVFLYGELATRPEQRERAYLRAGGWGAMAQRIESGELVPDYGPRRLQPRPRDRRRRGRQADSGGPARDRRRAAGSAGARRLPARPGQGPGVDQRRRLPDHPPAGGRRARARAGGSGRDGARRPGPRGGVRGLPGRRPGARFLARAAPGGERSQDAQVTSSRPWPKPSASAGA